jgi:chorismate mutase
MGKVDPFLIEDVYRNIIIPMTKDIEVAYLFRRCGKEPPAAYRE